jgi:hypothetical protein
MSGYFIGLNEFQVSALVVVLFLAEMNGCYALDPCKKRVIVYLKLISFSGCPNPQGYFYQL